jgi:hypothetical protein
MHLAPKTRQLAHEADTRARPTCYFRLAVADSVSAEKLALVLDTNPDANVSHDAWPAYRGLCALDGRAKRGWALAVGSDSITVVDL